MNIDVKAKDIVKGGSNYLNPGAHVVKFTHFLYHESKGKNTPGIVFAVEGAPVSGVQPFELEFKPYNNEAYETTWDFSAPCLIMGDSGRSGNYWLGEKAMSEYKTATWSIVNRFIVAANNLGIADKFQEALNEVGDTPEDFVKAVEKTFKGVKATIICSPVTVQNNKGGEWPTFEMYLDGEDFIATPDAIERFQKKYESNPKRFSRFVPNKEFKEKTSHAVPQTEDW